MLVEKKRPGRIHMERGSTVHYFVLRFGSGVIDVSSSADGHCLRLTD